VGVCRIAGVCWCACRSEVVDRIEDIRFDRTRHAWGGEAYAVHAVNVHRTVGSHGDYEVAGGSSQARQIGDRGLDLAPRQARPDAWHRRTGDAAAVRRRRRRKKASLGAGAGHEMKALYRTSPSCRGKPEWVASRHRLEV
jgi:hypothetical protein